jgi:hypothetical protein
MERKHESDLFLIGDGADELLTACSWQTKNVIDAMVHRDLEVGLGHGFLLTAVSRHILFSCAIAVRAVYNSSCFRGPNCMLVDGFQFSDELQRTDRQPFTRLVLIKTLDKSAVI